MKHKLHDITLDYKGNDQNAKKFTSTQNLVSDLYVHFLEGYKPPKTTKISVELGGHDEVVGYFESSILRVIAKFDKDKYWTLAELEQQKYILETVHKTALLCANEYGWDNEKFISAYNRVLEVNFKYQFTYKVKSAPNRKNKACLQIEKTEKHATLSVLFLDQFNNEIKQVELLKTFTNEMFYSGFIKNNKWLNDQQFGIYTQDNEIVISASLLETNSEIIFKPITKKLEELEGYLRMISYKEFKDHEAFVKWSNK